MCGREPSRSLRAGCTERPATRSVTSVRKPETCRASFPITTEEWYVWDRSPRARVHVLASVDESTYEFVHASQRGIRMGDHPVVWTKDRVAGRNLYIFMGHHPNQFAHAAYTTLLANSIMWLANGHATPR